MSNRMPKKGTKYSFNVPVQYTYEDGGQATGTGKLVCTVTQPQTFQGETSIKVHAYLKAELPGRMQIAVDSEQKEGKVENARQQAISNLSRLLQENLIKKLEEDYNIVSSDLPTANHITASEFSGSSFLTCGRSVAGFDIYGECRLVLAPKGIPGKTQLSSLSAERLKTASAQIAH